jgi:hypothetical protein
LKQSLWHFMTFVADELINVLAVNVFQQLPEIAHIHKRAANSFRNDQVLSGRRHLRRGPASLSSGYPSVIVRIERVSNAINNLAVLGQGHIDAGTALSVG